MIQKYIYKSKAKNYQKISPTTMQQSQTGSPRQHQHSNQYSQNEPIIGRNTAINDRNNPASPTMTLIIIFTVMTAFFVIFILFLVYLLTPSKPSKPMDKNQFSQMITLEVEKNSSQTVNNFHIQNLSAQQLSELEQLFAKNNNKGQPLDLFFAKFLVIQQNFPAKHKLQKLYYKKLFGDFNPENEPPNEQLSMCIVATGRNNMQGDRQKRFLQSVQDLEYNNYKVVYVDDSSSDETGKFTEQYVQRSEKLKGRTEIVLRNQRYYVLANKIKAIQQFCQQGDIIIDVDADDRFVGRQVLNIINYFYKKYSEVWFLYTNHILFNSSSPFNSNLLIKGPNVALSEQQFINYRTLDKWVTSHLKTYKRQLFMKIDRHQWKTDNGEVCHWASDRYIIYALMELAGIQHTKFFNVLLYFYDYTAASNIRNLEIIKPDKIRSKTLTPYKNLASLNEIAEKRQNYQPPKQLVESYRRAELKYKALLDRKIQNVDK